LSFKEHHSNQVFNFECQIMPRKSFLFAQIEGHERQDIQRSISVTVCFYSYQFMGSRCYSITDKAITENEVNVS